MASITAREIAYRMIRNRIITMDLKPGAMLNDKELADELGMSRTPVREALIMLNIARLVVVRPQRGTFVAPINAELAEEEQFIRYVLEKEMIHKACKRMTAVHRSRYEENLSLYKFYEQSQVPGQESKLLELDNEFHRIAFIINEKESYFQRMELTLQHIERLRLLSLMVIQEDDIYSDHQKIAEAVFEGDATKAAFWLETHLNRYQEHLKFTRKAFPEYFPQ